jgi:hypothetical protein
MNPTFKYAFTYGLLSGLVVICTLIVGIVLSGRASFMGTLWFGYLTMLVAMTFIFVGTKRYRDVELGGVIKFLPALGLGLAIAVVASLVYVAVWEAYMAATHYTYMDHYVAKVLSAQKAAGVAGAALAQEAAKLDTMRTQYANPLYRMPMTFMELFPVGVVVALISAGLLRNPKLLPAVAR